MSREYTNMQMLNQLPGTLFIVQSTDLQHRTSPAPEFIPMLQWVSEQGLTSPPTQYRLSGRQFYR